MSKNYYKLKNKRIIQRKVATKKVLISEERSEKKKCSQYWSILDDSSLFKNSGHRKKMVVWGYMIKYSTYILSEN